MYVSFWFVPVVHSSSIFLSSTSRNLTLDESLCSRTRIRGNWRFTSVVCWKFTDAFFVACLQPTDAVQGSLVSDECSLRNSVSHCEHAVIDANSRDPAAWRVEPRALVYRRRSDEPCSPSSEPCSPIVQILIAYAQRRGLSVSFVSFLRFFQLESVSVIRKRERIPDA
jgi:hypothetical protein